MVAELAAAAVFVLALMAERLHRRRVRRLALLAFGPGGRPAPWVRIAPGLRAVSLSLLTWGLVTLLLLPPKVHRAGIIPESQFRNLVLVLDVSPSMQLKDAGPSGQQTRRQRAADLLKSFFDRIPIELFRTSIVAVYSGAKPVVVNTTDLEIVNNIMTDLPMEFAFKVGPTELIAGLEEAARIAKTWRPQSTTVFVISDGDTVPATGMPRMPDSVANVLIVGVGDPLAGKFIAGHQSRQDASTLRQLAIRLNGHYHNGNEKHLPTDLVKSVIGVAGESLLEKLSSREYALIACGVGASILAFLPICLYWFGTRWRPGVTPSRSLAQNHEKSHRRVTVGRASAVSSPA